MANESAFSSVRQFNCPNCGGELQLYNKRTRYVGCQYCGAELDATQEPAKTLLKLDDAGKNAALQPFRFVALGTRMRLRGVSYIVIGRTRWQMNYQEYWSEEGETGYDRETWVFDEWLLLSEHYALAYLIEDSSGFTVSAPLVPSSPVFPVKPYDRVNFFGGRPQIIREVGFQKVLYHEGESTYEIKPNDTVFFGAYQEGNTTYSLEWREDGKGRPSEIEYYSDSPVPVAAVKAAMDGKRFGKITALSSGEDVQRKLPAISNLRFLGRIMAWTGFLLLVLGVLFDFGLNSQVVVHEAYNFETKQAAEQRFESLGELAFNIPKPNQVYELEVSAVLNEDNNYITFGAEIVSQDSLPLRAIEEEFWRESGTSYECDEDGCGYYDWSESDLSGGFLFRSDQAGTYILRLQLASPKAVSGAVAFELRQTVRTAFFYTLGIILWPLGWILGLYYRSRKRHLKRLWVASGSQVADGLFDAFTLPKPAKP